MLCTLTKRPSTTSTTTGLKDLKEHGLKAISILWTATLTISVRTLMTKADSGDTDFSAEIAQLETLKAEQQEEARFAVVEKEKSGMDAVICHAESSDLISDRQLTADCDRYRNVLQIA